MTIDEFETVRPLLTISEHRIEAAYSSLVLGEVYQKVAVRYGWSRQSVNETASIVLSVFDAYMLAKKIEHKAQKSHLPDNWDVLTIEAPMDLIKQFVSEVSIRRETEIGSLVKNTEKEKVSSAVDGDKSSKKRPRRLTVKPT
ncbi:hypothetical protein A1359_15830 [Methylomonas lenta]|uniref:TrfB transcriptional repressor protein domain-containing protein n=1 Tax=Methylomonas lenta TaxID=980561 RepID=A0A177N0Q0_9GAMM|nr:hypothetical protein [Methylomonas lenta]OAI10729.1 hypothetical protein A1359_15830 [Methylomonas lenta]